MKNRWKSILIKYYVPFHSKFNADNEYHIFFDLLFPVNPYYGIYRGK